MFLALLKNKAKKTEIVRAVIKVIVKHTAVIFAVSEILLFWLDITFSFYKFDLAFSVSILRIVGKIFKSAYSECDILALLPLGFTVCFSV